MDWRERIESDPHTLRGEPHIRGTAVLVSAILDELAAHLDFHDVQKLHPDISEDDLRACLAWAADADRVPARIVVVVTSIPADESAGVAATDAASEPGDLVLVYDGASHELEVKPPLRTGPVSDRRAAAVDAAWKQASIELTDLIRSMFHRAPTPEPLPTARAAPPAVALPEPTVYDFLLLGPNVGEDADFERRRSPRRELPEWDI
jgi:uncharacterized protein (DUF433 family)